MVQAPDGGRTFANALQNLGYTYDPNGRLQSRTDFGFGAAEEFGYDNLDRLTTWVLPAQEATVQYQYDDTGNLTFRQRVDPSGLPMAENYRYGENGAGPHALTTGPAGSYGYDAGGRQISRPGQPSIAYSYFDLPTQVTDNTAGSVTFAYDAYGTRVEKTTVNSDTITLGGLYERRTVNGTTTHVFYLPGDRTVVGQVSCDSHGTCSSPAFFHPDNLGTVDLVESNGTVVGREKRDPFGRLYDMTAGISPPAGVTLGFTGQVEDTEIGLIDFHHRLYDAQIGRFITPDPIVGNRQHGQDWNRYSYCRNSPLSFVDPTGLQGEGEGEGEDEGGGGGDAALAGELGTGTGLTPPPGADVRDDLAVQQPDVDGFQALAPDRTPQLTDIEMLGGGWWAGSHMRPDGVLEVFIFGPKVPSAAPQATDGEVPGQPPFASPAVSEAPTADFGKILVNSAVTTLVAPVVGLLEATGPNAPKMDMNAIRPFPYSQSEMASSSAVEKLLGIGITLPFGGVESGLELTSEVGAEAGAEAGAETAAETGAQNGVQTTAETGAKAAAETAGPLPVLEISSSKYPELADNITNAQAAGHPDILTWGGDQAANRAAATDGVPNIPGLSRDEYPFASTMEGGAGAWVGHIPASQNSAQGALIANFIRGNGILPGMQFRVAVVP